MLSVLEGRRKFLAASLSEAERCANLQHILELKTRLAVYSLPLQSMDDSQQAQIYLKNSARLADFLFKGNANIFWNECQRALQLILKGRD